ncbi:uncharacterized protein LACBIDRAFT_391733 [Laccaria bicolor S238N-H82]|uniref:Predicted protein n=1 Tax=Laccaria bicolor (strain S238N-H82 / ATCC MYA-4686) TaxID=486041 RepID=B0DM20_LACBS|nr:uncharacterized protein LACBIDRAFT_391733 [Laccaria bicolor S238N-H82]EDR04490.1 predicted protein [Laccaria bicolor S238N-H82]|eukprot:XP_001885009.1 predicted protein [Laccaria bicolor S238N-H82]
MADDPIPSVKAPAGTSDTEIRPCGHKIGGRNLIVCIDGTANQFGERNTNVIELYNRILKESGNQKTWYNSGIGTYVRPSWKSFKFYRQVLSHTIDSAIAWNFKRTVLGAYRWLSDNYEHGDCIFLFGFSRGAFEVRVLSAMIDKVGLIQRGSEMQIPFAYELYIDPKSDEPSTSVTVGSLQTTHTSSAERFKQTFSYKDVRVHFLGAWDTVSSIGIARRKMMLPRIVDGMKHVCFFRHALALDERRVTFLPEYAYGGSATCANPDDKNPSSVNHGSSDNGNKPSTINEGEATKDISTSDDVDRSQGMNKVTAKHPQTLEVWFAGTHSDIGGGNVQNSGMDLSRPPLRWMVLQAGELGLRTEPFERELSPHEQINVIESLTGFWWPLEFLFLKRLTYTGRNDGKKTTYKPHLGSGRTIHATQKIHGSLLLAGKLKSDYTPKARPFDDEPFFWDVAREKGLGDWLELDLYNAVRTDVEVFIIAHDLTVWDNLRKTVTRVNGRQALYDQVIDSLKPALKLTPEIMFGLLRNTVDILGRHRANLKLSPSIEIRPLIADLRHSNETRYQETAQQFMEQFTDPSIFVLSGHTNSTTSVTFSPDGRRVVSGSDDETIRIWDAETGKLVGEPFQGHTYYITSVAFSPDGRRVLSGSCDKTIRVWDAETGKPVGESLQGHTDMITSVAFSPDGRHVVSGSCDKTIRIWDLDLGEPVGEPLRGHTNMVNSVAFSPDGGRVVSGSDDETIWIWDVRTRMPVGEPFRGHNIVFSVAFSPDGRHVLSGSLDKTIRIWDAATGKPVGDVFQGHTNGVRSVAFSPDGRHVVSGSDDETIRIWDAETGKPVGEPFEGHTGLITSVAISPDGRRVLSGSVDKTIRIWDAETQMSVGELLLNVTSS